MLNSDKKIGVISHKNLCFQDLKGPHFDLNIIIKKTKNITFKHYYLIMFRLFKKNIYIS